MKKITILLLISAVAFSKTLPQDALSATVVNVASNDVLNVRSKPDWHSQKVASIAPYSAGSVRVSRCKIVGKSTWCKIYPLNDIEGYGYGAPSGWVNARYLSLSSRGYVSINGKKSCYYSLYCKNRKCKVVIDYKENSKYDVIALKTKIYPKSAIKAETNFSAMPENDEGYCVAGRKIEEFLSKKR